MIAGDDNCLNNSQCEKWFQLLLPHQLPWPIYNSTVFRVNRAAMGREDLEVAQEKDWAQVGE